MTQLNEQQFSGVAYHGTQTDLDRETHVLPPAVTGRKPNWDDMDPAEDHQVFMARTPESAHYWATMAGSDDARGDWRVYEVEPEDIHMVTEKHVVASRARIIKRVR
jgi:hypothetical protein